MIITNLKSLNKKCSPILVFDATKIIKRLEDELALTYGIGLASNQIGIDVAVCIIRLSDFKLDLVNPVILKQSKPIVFKGEQCLSFPGQKINTRRFNEVVIKDDFNGELKLMGLKAIVAAHEIGHTMGLTMFDFKV